MDHCTLAKPKGESQATPGLEEHVRSTREKLRGRDEKSVHCAEDSPQ
jgi:hypothetical protein